MKYYGFNFQWMCSWKAGEAPQPADERALDFLCSFGFNFVRIPLDYRFWTQGFDYFHPDDSIFKFIDGYVDACRSRGIHLSLNLHRAPGYCTNRNDLERHNLWLDEAAQKAFLFLWETFGLRYNEVPANFLSFDLVNEPPSPGQYGMTRENHAALMKRTIAAIRRIDPDRPITIDGLGGGYLAMPELAGTDLTHSRRGYVPMPISHHQASWWSGHRDAPTPRYPGLLWQGRIWNRNSLRKSFKAWREVEKMGTKIHIGEFGCFNRTPNEVAIRWLSDLLSVFRELGWGYAMWNFQGPFGIIEHGRQGARLEKVYHYDVDRDLLELMIQNRVME